MADIRINALATTAASTASDDFVAVDGSANGTRKLNAYSPTFGGNLTVNGTDVKINNAAGYFYVDSGSSATGMVLSRTNNILELLTANTTRLTISSAGNTTLSGNLTVSGTGTSSVAGNLNFNGTGAATPPAGLNYGLFPQSGLGLGINSAAGGVGVWLAANGAFRLNSGTATNDYTGFEFTNATIGITGSSAYVRAIRTASSGSPTDLAFGIMASGTLAEAARFKSNGNLLIGTTVDDTIGKLQVNGKGTFANNVNINPASSGGLYVTSGSTSVVKSKGAGDGILDVVSGTGDPALRLYAGSDAAAATWVIGSDQSDSSKLKFSYNSYLPGTGDLFTMDTSGNATISGSVTVSGGSILAGAYMVIKTSYTPASAAASGIAGEITWDANYIYVCTANGAWKRAAISTW